MEPEVLNVLEFDKIRERLAERAGSLRGKELARRLLPSGNIADVRQSLAVTAEAVRICRAVSPPLGGIMDIRPALKKLRLGAVLDVGELSEVMSTMFAMRNVKKFFKELEMDAPHLKEQAQTIELLGELERDLANTIDERGAIRDDASVELRRIRRELSTAKVRIKERVSAVLHDPDRQKFFQESIVTVRDGRYVVPVKQEYRAAFPGLIHDQSASGATLFIEPMAVVELNNDVKRLTLAEHHEVERILKLLSGKLRQKEAVLEQNAAVLAAVDLAVAKARLAEDMGATEPQINDAGLTRLYAARHPLINSAAVVPVDMILGESYRLLLITGPNTGGKTVSLKTLGLLAVMTEAGLFIPAAPGSEIAVYQNIYADIGDEQSIEQSLSTFSAHMTRIVAILEKASAKDLLLLDELGAGTDPEEGAALSMAILEKLLTEKVSTVATTHYSELKTFAYSTDGIQNASVEFDAATLTPTYRLLIGVPGASNAFAISSRLGLSEKIVARAKELITADHARFENVVSDLEQERLRYEKRRADIDERQRRAAEAQTQAEKMRQELLAKKGDIIKKAREQGAAIVKKARREAEEIIASLNEQFADFGVKKRRQTIQEARARLSEAADDLAPRLMTSAQMYRTPVDLASLKVGDTVYVVGLAQTGTVTDISGKELTVEMGSLHTQAKAKDCRFVKSGKVPAANDRDDGGGTVSGSFAAKTREISTQIDIRGLMVNEAEALLGKFIDDAVLAGLKEVLIIHGKGTGALRKGVHEYLKRHRNVAGYGLADMDAGGSGATNVKLSA